MAQVPLQDYNKSTLQVPANAGGSNFLKDEDISSASSSGSSSPANQSGDGSHLEADLGRKGKTAHGIRKIMSDEDINSASSLTLESAESGYESKSSPVSVASSSSSGPALIDDEDIYIVQTEEQLTSYSERDRSKRFDFLLKQTEIWGHFMQPAYQEALDCATKDKSDSGDSPPGPSNKRKRKAPFTLPSKPSDDGRKKGPAYTTHFDVSPPFIVNGCMRDYQVRGLNWMISLSERGISGILADEMGLGKTIQAISLLGYLKHVRSKEGPHLIIAPKSTLPNWMNELKKWCPTLKVICLIGSKEERPSFIKNSFLPKRWNVCVTSYEMARIEISTLAKINYHYLIIDEAQKIKNENSLLSTCVRRLRSQSRLLLTGTPLQNNLHELWALLNFLLPDVFSSSEDFDSWFNESSCIGNQSLVDRLHAVLRPFLLRRIKSDVEKSLPPKKELRLYVQMTPMQREWYRKILLNDIEVVNSNTGRTTRKALHNILMHLRKVCNHPYLFEGAEPKPFTTDIHLVTNCGKMIVLDKLLLKLKEQKSRVLLFSQMTRMLDILEDYCIWRDFEYCRLDGSTDYDIRQEDIDAFNAPNSSKFIYLLSTRAGGLGINLASADIVIIYDSDWNPQMDLQAMDRAHRIGQTKEVKVFRFVVQETAEEKIVERAAAKLHLDKMVIQQDIAQQRLLSTIFETGRLVGADDKSRQPDSKEMLSIVRFGAEKILKHGKNEGVTDADIDIILAKSKIKSDQLDCRLQGMTEDNLKDLTIEDVEFNWEKKQPDQEYTSFNFEGQDYRELRKRKSIKVNEMQKLMLEGKRRKDKTDTSTVATKNVPDDDRQSEVSNDGYDSSLTASDSESEEGKLPDSEEFANPAKKPTPPSDFHFYPHYMWELHWRKVDYFRRITADFKLNCLPDCITLQDLQTLTLAETARLKKCNVLNSAESREILMLKYDGFSSWKKKHFTQFINAMAQYGPENLEALANAITGKEAEEVVRYSQVFWLRCHELLNFEEIMSKLKRPELVKERRSKLQNLLNAKIKNAKNTSDIKVTFEPHHWIGHRFSAEDDIKLLIAVTDIGLMTPDVFEVLRCKLSESQNEDYSPFLRTRTKEELHTRLNMLIHMIEKEAGVDNSVFPQSSAMGTASASGSETPSKILIAKNLMEQKLKVASQKMTPAKDKKIKTATPKVKAQTPKKRKVVAEPKSEDLLL